MVPVRWSPRPWRCGLPKFPHFAKNDHFAKLEFVYERGKWMGDRYVLLRRKQLWTHFQRTGGPEFRWPRRPGDVILSLRDDPFLRLFVFCGTRLHRYFPTVLPHVPPDEDSQHPPRHMLDRYPRDPQICKRKYEIFAILRGVKVNQSFLIFIINRELLDGDFLDESRFDEIDCTYL